MLDIDEMSSKEIHELLHQVGYGHLGCIHEGKPYVMPMNYYLEGSDIYLFTTEGMKTHDIDANPEICLQVEEIHDPLHWRSVDCEWSSLAPHCSGRHRSGNALNQRAQSNALTCYQSNLD